MSVTWGGAGHILVPVGDSGDVSPEVWRLVELYDADCWAAYAHTRRGLELDSPAEFQVWLEREAKRWARKYGGGVKQARETLTGQQLMNEPLRGGDLPDAFAERLRRWTGPEVEHGRLGVATYSPDGEPGHELTDVGDLTPLPDRVQVLDTRALPLSLRVLLAARIGALAPSQVRRLMDRGVAVETVLVDPDDLEHLLMVAWAGASAFDSWRLQVALLRRMSSGNISERPYHAASFLDEVPMALSVLGCNKFSRQDQNYRDRQLVVVAGSHVDDFAYALALERCGVPAMWLPEEFVSGTDRFSRTVREALTRSLSASRHHSTENPVMLCSLSMTTSQLRSLSQRLLKTTWGLQASTEVCSEVELPRQWVNAFLDPEAFEDPLDTPFRGEEMASGVPVVSPSEVRSEDPWKLRWWVDVETPDHVVAPRSVLHDLAVGESDRWGARARFTRTGIAFHSHTMGFVPSGAARNQMLDRPRLRLPSAFAVFERLAADARFNIVESAAGHFRRLSIDYWGGLDELAADLAEESTSLLLKAWLSSARSGETPGVLTGGKRRVLNIADGCVASGLESQELRPVLDRYLEAGILRRGLVLQCPHCRLCEWYELGSVAQTFDCARCHTRSSIVASTWKGGGNEPDLYYDLAEVVLQALRENVDVPVAALAHLKKGSLSFLHVPEFEVIDKDGNAHLELDLAAIVDGRLVIGEAKSGNRIGKTSAAGLRWLRKLAAVADGLTVDEVVFATAARSWDQTTKDNIATAFGGSQIRTRLIENV